MILAEKTAANGVRAPRPQDIPNKKLGAERAFCGHACGMGIIDTHTHLDSLARSGALPDTLARAREAGLEAMIAIGTAPDDWALNRSMAGDHAGLVHYTAGLHPCHVDRDWADAVAQLGEFWKVAQASRLHATEAGGTPALPRPVALGECGLDRFHLPKDDPAAAGRIFAWQRAAFAAQLEIAKRLGCPVVVHSRGAFNECVEMIDASGVDWARVVFHCFTEGETEMAELTRRGGFGSFTGVITYKSAGIVRAAALAQGLGRLMIETDAPYLTPMPHRGKPNEPAYLRHTGEFSAGVFGVSYDELAAVTTANAKKFFGI
jgi:TatD DNase family protein